MVFITEGITEGFFEVAIESWPESDSNPRPLNSVQTDMSPLSLLIKLILNILTNGNR